PFNPAYFRKIPFLHRADDPLTHEALPLSALPLFLFPLFPLFLPLLFPLSHAPLFPRVPAQPGKAAGNPACALPRSRSFQPAHRTQPEPPPLPPSACSDGPAQ